MESYKRHAKSELTPEESAELVAVDALADRLRSHIGDTAPEIKDLHVHGAQSKAVQDHMARLLKDELGFGEEVVLTPQTGLVTQARPDFFLPISGDRGVIAEVERGGATTNNHDLKDLWKAHVAPDVQHLFLIVPQSNWRADGTSREKPFPLVARRLGAFFGSQRREIDVVSVHVFGY
ncbi:hypothetical protein [Nocardioides sp. CFH 31398]|uniref:hypothetical protein n=1 Tax=Nocardioides sp. CFH 31398 TaxID=2919579 RepID=UPI001F06F658|nr:hypothetical protein [Nocardioides sp. CFH 31398]MCH1867423.1 hypothetical protein [Nocardioides sp. CFH 31398]